MHANRRELGVFVLFSFQLATGAWALGANLIPNGDFDDAVGAEGWLEPSEKFTHLVQISEDVDDCADSGSGDGSNSSDDTDDASGQFRICASPITPGESYRLTGMVRFPVGTDPSRFNAGFVFSSNANCQTGGLNGAGIPAFLESTTTTEWTQFVTDTAVAPENAVTARISLTLTKYSMKDNVSDVYFDRIVFSEVDFIYAEDFEIGSPCRWSDEVGVEP